MSSSVNAEPSTFKRILRICRVMSNRIGDRVDKLKGDEMQRANAIDKMWAHLLFFKRIIFRCYEAI